MCLCYQLNLSKTPSGGVALIILATAGIAQAAQVVVDFDDLVGDNILVPDGYGGINWDSNWIYYGFDQFPYTPESIPNRVYQNYDKWPDFNQTYAIPFYFPSFVRFDGAYFAGEAPVTFELYNSGSLVATSGTLTSSSTPTFLASGYAGLVDEVRVVSNTFRVMDNVTYNTDTETVPEPSTILGLGLLGFGAFCQRKLAQGKKSKQDN